MFKNIFVVLRQATGVWVFCG